MEKIVQTAGRDALGEFAPEFARPFQVLCKLKNKFTWTPKI